jgi:hypothetical protein
MNDESDWPMLLSNTTANDSVRRCFASEDAGDSILGVRKRLGKSLPTQQMPRPLVGTLRDKREILMVEGKWNAVM